MAIVPGEEQVPDARFGKVEDGCRPRTLDDLEVERVQHRPDELALGTRNERPQEMPALNDVEPFCSSLLRVRA